MRYTLYLFLGDNPVYMRGWGGKQVLRKHGATDSSRLCKKINQRSRIYCFLSYNLEEVASFNSPKICYSFNIFL